MSLRVGLLVHRTYCLAWEAAVVQRIRECGVAEIPLVILLHPEGHDTKPGFWQTLYSAVDRRLFRLSLNAFRKIRLEDALPDAQRLTLKTPEGRTPVHEDAERIRLSRLDVILDLEGGESKVQLCDLATKGLWRCRMGLPAVEKTIPGFLELARKIGILKSSLEMTRRGGEEVHTLWRSFTRVDRISLGRTNNIAAWKCASFVSRELGKLASMGEAGYLNRVARQGACSDLVELPMHSLPSAASSFVTVARQFCRIAATAISKPLFVNKWVLAYSFGDTFGKPFQTFPTVEPPKDRFWADPHIISRNGEWFIFFEELPFSTGKGHLSVISVNRNGDVSQPRRVLERPYHLSYPFVFQWDGVHYMVPETGQNRTIELYECKGFPDNWELKQVLMNGVRAVDSTLVYYRSKWWMFVNMAEHEGNEMFDELYLFYADDFRTNAWTPHPLNPIVSDIRNARPAGRVFEHEGFLIRPAQDCSSGYGSATNLNRIVKLSETEYEEVLLQTIRPSWERNLVGLHTISVDHGLTVIDLCRRTWRWSS